MAAPQPGIGDWYRQKEGGALFEVVAFDDDDGTIEIQYFDGTVEEMDIEDWDGQWEDGTLESADPPEDWSGSVDVEPDDDCRRADASDTERDLRASGLDGNRSLRIVRVSNHPRPLKNASVACREATPARHRPARPRRRRASRSPTRS